MTVAVEQNNLESAKKLLRDRDLTTKEKTAIIDKITNEKDETAQRLQILKALCCVSSPFFYKPDIGKNRHYPL